MSIEPAKQSLTQQAIPLLKRLARQLILLLVSLLIASVFFIGLYQLGCVSVHGCDDFKGLGIAVFAFLLSIVVWATLLSVYSASQTRKGLRIAVILVTIGLIAAVWITPLMTQ